MQFQSVHNSDKSRGHLIEPYVERLKGFSTELIRFCKRKEKSHS